MSSAFSFVPRTVSNAKRKSAQPHPQATAPRPVQTSVAGSEPDSTRPSNTGASTNIGVKYSNEDYASLLSLALSDYALWQNPDIRQRNEWSSDTSSSADVDGFFPLSYLLKHSQLLAPLNLENSQMPIAKAIRSGDGADVLEIRLLVSDPSPSTWFGGPNNTRDLGSYEIRRKDWKEALTRSSRNYSRADWDKRTIYMENIPVQHRNTPTIARFILALLAARPSLKARLTRVQSIIFPPHHQDKPGDHPTCKGFALVVLEDELDVDFLLNDWPWERRQDTHTHLNSPEEQEATKFGLRALPKLRWDQLKEEYLAYRGRLVGEINAHEDAESAINMPSTSKSTRQQEATVAPPTQNEVLELEQSNAIAICSSSPYPFNSLVFVRNIHPETNKTTLRKFFATAFRMSIIGGDVQGDGLDYVDYNKAMDSCHLRLTTPKHAQILIGHFSTHPTSHTGGLDESGAPADDKSPAVSMDLVTGRREELYWEKVPEKVRRQAVQKALALIHGSPNIDTRGSGGALLSANEPGEGDTRKRKRRKH